MEFPSAESIGKFFGGSLVVIAGGWAFLKKIGLIGRDSKEQMEEDSTPPIRLRRAEDTGIKLALETTLAVMETRIKAVEARSIEDRTFILGQIKETEGRLNRDIGSSVETLGKQISEVSGRIEDHYQGINGRLDALLRK